MSIFGKYIIFKPEQKKLFALILIQKYVCVRGLAPHTPHRGSTLRPRTFLELIPLSNWLLGITELGWPKYPKSQKFKMKIFVKRKN